MSQHDYDIANAPGASVRADLNALVAAIATQNSGPSAPAVTFPFMMWLDESTNQLKIRNSANTSWLTVAEVTSTFTPFRQGTALGNAATRTIGVGAADQVPDRAAADTRWVQRAGDTITGDLTVAKEAPVVTMDATGATHSVAILRMARNGTIRWEVGVTGDAAQNWLLSRFNDAGVYQDTPLVIDRASGRVTFSRTPIGPNADPTANNELARKSYVDGRVKYFQSSFINWTSGGTVNFAHGLGTIPFLVWPVAHCLTSEHGYTGGVSWIVLPPVNDNGGMPLPGTIRVDSANIAVQFGTPSPSTVMAVVNHATTGARVALTSTNWQLRYHAVAFAL